MSDKIVALAFAGAILLACQAADAAPAPPARPAAAPAMLLKTVPIPRRANGRVDSNALFARIAASRAVDLPVLIRLDRYKVRALVLAVARNDGAAIDHGLRELIDAIQALPPAEQKDTDVSEMVMVIAKAAAVEAYPDLNALMNEMNARRVQKEETRDPDDELALLRARLILCDLKRPCAPPDGKPLQADGVPRDVVQSGSDLRQRRVEALAAAVAMIAANAERMDTLAQSIVHHGKP